MKFLTDEGVDRQIVERLRQDGHAVAYVAEMEPGISDESVLELARQDSLALLTSDKDFGELVYRQSLLTSGVVLIRLSGLSPEKKSSTVSSAISSKSSEFVPETFSVISPGRVRIRKKAT